MLDLKKLTYLEAVYHYRSFTKASEVLFVTQPTISLAIRALEDEYKIKLIDREQHGISFTREGEQFILCVQRILKECKQTEITLREFSEKRQKTLLLGLSPSLGVNLQKYIFSFSFHEQFPNIHLSIDEAAMNVHIEKIRRGELDLSFNVLPHENEFSDLEFVPISFARIECVMRPDHFLANKAEISLPELADVLIASPGKNSGTYYELMKQFEKDCIIPNIHSFHEQILSMLNTVILGNFVGFICMSDLYTEEQLRRLGLISRKLNPALQVRQGFIWSRDRQLPRIGRDLIEIVKHMQDL